MSRRLAVGCATVLFVGCDLVSPTARDVTITIRNDWDKAAILEITEPPGDVPGRVLAVVAPLISLDPGQEEAVRIRVSIDRWTLRFSNGDRGFLYSDDLLAAVAQDSGAYVHIDDQGRLALEDDP